MDMTIIFFVIVGLLFIGCGLLWKRLNKVEDRVRAPQLYQEDNGLYKFAADIHRGLDKRIEKFEAKRKAKRTNKKEGKV